MFLGKDNFNRTAWHMTAKNCQIDLLHKLNDWARNVLTTEELNTIFSPINVDERTAWHVETKNGKLDILHIFWECDNRY
jgi:hypothetical protein